MTDMAHVNIISGVHLDSVNNIGFLHDRPWISPWIKSISNELYNTLHVIASQLYGHCDVISTRLWRHHQKVERASEPPGRYVKIVVFIFIYGFVMSCNKYSCMKKIYGLSWQSVYALTRVLFWRLYLRNSGNKHQITLSWAYTSLPLEYIHYFIFNSIDLTDTKMDHT